jgi:hypothetical protein
MLRRHPGVFLPDAKELQYFNDEWYGPPGTANERARRPLEWYLGFFAAARPGQVCGEITPTYLWNATAPRRIADFDPGLNLFAILRDPTDQVFSSYLFSLQKGEIPAMGFEQCLEEHGYIAARAMYGEHVDRYLEHFPRQQLLVLLYDDLIVAPHSVLTSIQRHIGVPPQIPEEVTERRNVTGLNRYPALNRGAMRARLAMKRYRLEPFVEAIDRAGLGRPFRWLQGQVRPYDHRPTMAKDTEARLRERFRPDLERLERALGLDLTRWKPRT